MTDLVQRLRDSVTQARAVDRAALLHEAADEIERLRRRPASGDIVTRLRQTRANMIGTDDEAHYWDCHEAAGDIEKLRRRLRFADAALRSEGKTLTDEELEAIQWAIATLDAEAALGDGEFERQQAATLRSLLERLQGS